MSKKRVLHVVSDDDSDGPEEHKEKRMRVDPWTESIYQQFPIEMNRYCKELCPLLGEITGVLKDITQIVTSYLKVPVSDLDAILRYTKQLWDGYVLPGINPIGLPNAIHFRLCEWFIGVHAPSLYNSGWRLLSSASINHLISYGNESDAESDQRAPFRVIQADRPIPVHVVDIGFTSRVIADKIRADDVYITIKPAVDFNMVADVTHPVQGTYQMLQKWSSERVVLTLKASYPDEPILHEIPPSAVQWADEPPLPILAFSEDYDFDCFRDFSGCPLVDNVAILGCCDDAPLPPSIVTPMGLLSLYKKLEGDLTKYAPRNFIAKIDMRLGGVLV